MAHNNHIFIYIMSDPKNSIAANFKNAIQLPPIGVFWDIENIQVPRGKSASVLCSVIRRKFLKNHREAEFLCVCDINKENKTVISELNLAQVTVVHIDAISKNAADEKLRQCMRRYIETHPNPSTLLLISDDVNFAPDLSDFRHRRHVKIILLHRSHAPDALLACASEEYDFNELMANLPCRSPQKFSLRPTELLVTNLPTNVSFSTIKKHLSIMSDNCGGKVHQLSRTKAIISFTTADATERAQKRMDKEVICKQSIDVHFLPRDSKEWKEMTETMANRKYFNLNKSYDDSDTSESSTTVTTPRKKNRNRSSNNSKKLDRKSFVFPKPPILTADSPNLLKPRINSLNDPSSSKQETFKNVKFSSFWQRETNHQQRIYRQKLPDRDSADFLPPANFVPLKQQPVLKTNVSPYVQHDQQSKLGIYNYGHPLPLQGLKNFNIKSLSVRPSSSSDLDLCRDSCMAGPSIQRSNSVIPACGTLVQPVELCVTNLDQGIEVNEMKHILQSLFREHVMVLHISMVLHADNLMKALVKVPSIHDAQFAISQLQRKMIGHKRIVISHVVNERNLPHHVLRSEVVSLLKDVPSKKLPLFKFRELYEKRNHRAISISELYKMREAVYIDEDSKGRTVCLNSDYQTCSSCTDSDSLQDAFVTEKPYCERHFVFRESEGWAEQDSARTLPDVVLSLAIFCPAVHRLLESHLGSLPLSGFCSCYEAEIGNLPVVQSSGDESFSSDVVLQGVPLEHLITCVPGVEIVKNGFAKKVQWCENTDAFAQARSVSPQLVGPLVVFGREIAELLKNQLRCMVLFNKLIPAYHHHFGKQCRVADYGFTKLIELLDAIPHIIQVFGEGQTRFVTLTHRIQVKRFAADLLRILKAQATKQIKLSEFSGAYETTLEKAFSVTNYGVCDVRDLLCEMSENTVLTNETGGDLLISIPKRDQTQEEIERTQIFATEVVELLKHTKNCRMTFNKFIPAYHHHFGKQCRVADFGFTKLIELFEAIPIIEVLGNGEQKVLRLVDSECFKILNERLLNVLKTQTNGSIGLYELEDAYRQAHGHVLCPAEFGALDSQELVKKLNGPIKVIETKTGTSVLHVDREFLQNASLNIRFLLMQQHEETLALSVLSALYLKRFGHTMDLTDFPTEFDAYVTIEHGVVQLKPLQVFARNALVLLQEGNGSLPLGAFRMSYEKRFESLLNPNAYGYTDVFHLLRSLPEYFAIKGKKDKQTVRLNASGPSLELYRLAVKVETSDSKLDSDLRSNSDPCEQQQQGSSNNFQCAGFFVQPSETSIRCTSTPICSPRKPMQDNACCQSEESKVPVKLEDDSLRPKADSLTTRRPSRICRIAASFSNPVV